MGLLLGVDVGTTNTKAVVFDTAGLVVAQEALPTPCLRQPDGGTLHDADSLWETVVKVVRSARERLPEGAQVVALAVASVGEEVVPVDAEGRPTAHSIAWFDIRTEKQAAGWKKAMSSVDTFRVTGLPVHSIYSVFKMQWVRENQPEAFDRAQCWLGVADYISFRLTGELCTSLSLASRTMLFDLRGRTWSEEMLQAAGLRRTSLPEPVPSGVQMGRITAEAARLTGLLSGTPVMIGGHDHICGALAAGVLDSGQVFDSAGTAEALLVALSEPVLDPVLCDLGIAVGCHTARDKYYALGAIMAGGVADWFFRLCDEDADTGRRGALEAAHRSQPGAKGLFCLPYLIPSAHPGWGRTGTLHGLTIHHTRGDLVRAALEGLAFEARRLYDLMTTTLKVKQGQIQFTGGLSRSRLVMEIKANVFGMPVMRVANPELVAQGAALLAGIGARVYHSEEAAVEAVRQTQEHVDPAPATVAIYRDLYKAYSELASMLQDRHV